MTRARRKLISLDSTPYYHCVSRCVRRAFWCGEDHYTQQNYDHRRQWIVDRLKQLTNVFAINIAAYCVMFNHCHVVVRIERNQASQCSNEEVVLGLLSIGKAVTNFKLCLMNPHCSAVWHTSISIPFGRTWRRRRKPAISPA